MTTKPLVLMILDGWGERKADASNAISEANTPNWDWLTKHALCGSLKGSGHAVGLPEGQMGNSEVGHMTIGLGRVIEQDLTRIHHIIDNDKLSENLTLQSLIHISQQSGRKLHILGLLSPGGVHSHEDHWFAVLQTLAKQGVDHVYCHPILDGRDTPPKSAAHSIKKLEDELHAFPHAGIVSLIGRYYAMDRDKRWDRIEAAYRLFVEGDNVRVAETAKIALDMAYVAKETDEFVKPTLIVKPGESPVTIAKDDLILCINFRSDRMREITQSFISEDFSHFKRPWHIPATHYFTFTNYADYLPTQILFPPTSLAHSLADCLAAHKLKQLRLAETEKYAHVTFFFNGGIETPVIGEDRQLIPSPKVATYDLQPEMSAPEVTDALVAAIESKKYDFIVINYANADMVGHSGHLNAAILAVEAIDACLGRVLHALKANGGELLLTADHGNAECMQDPITGEPHTAHTSDPVPLRYLGRPAVLNTGEHTLADLAPTVLMLLGLPMPEEMTGHPLFCLRENHHA